METDRSACSAIACPRKLTHLWRDRVEGDGDMKSQLLLIILAVILFAANTSQATVVYFDTTDPFVLPGETISIGIFSTVETDSIRMDRISDADFGIASNLYLNPDYPPGSGYNEGVAVNNNGVLIESIKAGIGLPTWSGVSGVLYSFDYLVPIAPFGHTITIFADPSNGAINEVFCNVAGYLVYITPESLTLTVVPEPATFFLFALGSLFLKRARK
jgi:hypothetical protein